MRLIQKNNPDDGKRGPVPPVPPRDLIVFQQMNTLLGTFSTLTAMLGSLRPSEDHPGGALDGGIKAAIETSVILTCNRIDTLLQDKACWGLAEQTKLENSLMLLYNEHREFLKDQREAIRMTTAPQSRLGPQLIRLPDGNWSAFIGDVHTPSSVVGIGRTVSEALASFDAAVEGKLSDYQKQWITEYEKKLDTDGRCDASGPDATGEDPRTDSSAAGPELQSDVAPLKKNGRNQPSRSRRRKRP